MGKIGSSLCKDYRLSGSEIPIFSHRERGGLAVGAKVTSLFFSLPHRVERNRIIILKKVTTSLCSAPRSLRNLCEKINTQAVKKGDKSVFSISRAVREEIVLLLCKGIVFQEATSLFFRAEAQRSRSGREGDRSAFCVKTRTVITLFYHRSYSAGNNTVTTR